MRKTQEYSATVKTLTRLANMFVEAKNPWTAKGIESMLDLLEENKEVLTEDKIEPQSK